MGLLVNSTKHGQRHTTYIPQVLLKYIIKIIFYYDGNMTFDGKLNCSANSMQIIGRKLGRVEYSNLNIID